MCRIHTLRQTIPIKSLGHVNSYAIEPEPGGDWILVDPGYYSARSLHDLVKQARASGLRFENLRAMIATHFHVDHLSLAPLLQDLTGAPLFMDPREKDLIEKGVPDLLQPILDAYREHGMLPEEIQSILEHHPLRRLAAAYDELLKNTRIQPLEGARRLGNCILTPRHTPGHTPGHMMVELSLLPREGRGTKILLTGDHVLPHITPHVVPYDPRGDMLGRYLESLRETQRLYAGVRGLPGHREPLPDTGARASELLQHHEQRLAEARRLLEDRGPLTAYQVARMMRWRTRYSSWEDYPPPERFFAMGEALAHLIHLESRGLVSRTGGVPVKWRATPL